VAQHLLVPDPLR